MGGWAKRISGDDNSYDGRWRRPSDRERPSDLPVIGKETSAPSAVHYLR